MKTPKSIQKITLFFLPVLSLFFISSPLNAQKFSATQTGNSIQVEGTSNVHDWDLKAEKFTVQAEITKGENQPEIKSLLLDLDVESLKSGKSGMDKNTYKAMKTDQHKKITFRYSRTVNTKVLSGNKYEVTAQGSLQIAGVTKNATITSQIEQKRNTYVLTGSHTIKMEDFNITPPTALLGSIKTGEEVTIKFQITLK